VLTDESAASFASALPDGRWMRVEDAAHTVQGDNPRGLVEALRPFLRESNFSRVRRFAIASGPYDMIRGRPLEQDY